MGRNPHEHSSPTDHQAITTHVIIGDSDTVIFPRDDNDSKMTKNIEEKTDNNQNSELTVDKDNAASKDDVSLILKRVPAVEVKEEFTNAAENKEIIVNKKIIDNDADEDTDATQIMIGNYNRTEIEVEATETSDETVPGLSIRFGGTSDYIVLHASKNQNYRTQHTTNVPYIIQSIVPQVSTNTIQYGTDNDPNQLTLNRSVQDPVSNVYNTSQINTNYVPANTQNTYMINGHLYAARTAPDNLEVLSPLYFVNAQNSGYQVSGYSK